jgi:two-component system sensor histidine kinase KdpD
MFSFLDSANLVMAYLLAIVIVARRHGRGPSVVAALLSVGLFDLLFVPPYYTFAVSDVRYLFTFAVMLAVALAMSGLTVRIRAQADAARDREQQASVLYAMSREIAGTRDVDTLVAVVARHLGEIFGGRVIVLLPDAGGRLVARGPSPQAFELDTQQHDLAQRLYENPSAAGVAPWTPRGGRALLLPLLGSRGPVGALGVLPDHRSASATPEQRHQLETFANQTALALERAQLANEAEAARVRIETEELKNSLLSSVSHDLRTPLAAITGAASTLLEGGDGVDAATRRELLDSIHEEAERLNRLVQNLLEMTRLTSGALSLRRQWHPLEEVIGAALGRLGKRLADRRVITRIPEDLPLVQIDDVLIEQVLINLLDNAAKHTASGTPITVVATATDRTVTVEVTDHGPGLPRGEEDEVFEKFYRGAGAGGRGAGLGLAICKAIIQAHGGHIWAQNVPEGGAAFFFTLPNPDAPPALVPEEKER